MTSQYQCLHSHFLLLRHHHPTKYLRALGDETSSLPNDSMWAFGNETSSLPNDSMRSCSSKPIFYLVYELYILTVSTIFIYKRNLQWLPPRAFASGRKPCGSNRKERKTIFVDYFCRASKMADVDCLISQWRFEKCYPKCPFLINRFISYAQRWRCVKIHWTT